MLSHRAVDDDTKHFWGICGRYQRSRTRSLYLVGLTMDKSNKSVADFRAVCEPVERRLLLAHSAHWLREVDSGEVERSYRNIANRGWRTEAAIFVSGVAPSGGVTSSGRGVKLRLAADAVLSPQSSDVGHPSPSKAVAVPSVSRQNEGSDEDGDVTLDLDAPSFPLSGKVDSLLRSVFASFLGFTEAGGDPSNFENYPVGMIVDDQGVVVTILTDSNVDLLELLQTIGVSRITEVSEGVVETSVPLELLSVLHDSDVARAISSQSAAAGNPVMPPTDTGTDKDGDVTLDVSLPESLVRARDFITSQHGKIDSQLAQTWITLNDTGELDGYVTIDAAATTDDGGKGLLDALTELGLVNGIAYQNLVGGILPVASISRLGAVASLGQVQLTQVGSAHGSVDSEGDAVQSSDDARSRFGVTGTGVTVGVISDSFNRFNDYAADVSTGDLPSGVQNLQELTNPGITPLDEGRAMAQIVHDVAPGAMLAFHWG